MIRLAIVAASPLARAGLAAMLSAPDYEIIASVPNFDTLEDSLEENEADVLLIDSPDPQTLASAWRGPGHSSAFNAPMVLLAPDEVSNRLSNPKASVLGPSSVSRNGNSHFAAVLPNNISPDQLRAAINAVVVGLDVTLPGTMSPYSASSITNSNDMQDSATLSDLSEPLTPRERQVLQMLASGIANKEIAARLNISDHTAKFHVAAILGKLGASTRTEAVTIAIRHGLILL